MQPAIATIYGLVKDTFFPNICLVCGEIVQNSKLNCCSSCVDQLEQTRYNNWVGDITYSNDIDEAYSVWFFNKELQTIVHGLKYNNYEKLVIIWGS